MASGSQYYEMVPTTGIMSSKRICRPSFVQLSVLVATFSTYQDFTSTATIKQSTCYSYSNQFNFKNGFINIERSGYIDPWLSSNISLANKYNLHELPFGPNGPRNGNTGITLTQFHHFEKRPAEVRNMIYKQLIVSKETIQICSPLKRHRRRYHRERLNFAAIMLVDKDIHEEVRGLYYTLNTFAVGNNLWGSTSFANLHGLNAFMKLAPKQHLAQIQNIEINLCAELVPHWARPELFYCHDELDGKRLMSICRILLKHFRGLRHVVIKACEMDMKPVTSGKDKRMRPIVQQGDWENAGKALRLLLDGNRKGSRGLLGLNIQRFRWYVNQNIQWSRVPDCAPGARTRPSFAGFMEQGRPELLNEEGVWDPMGITDKTMDQVRSKELKNARAGIV